MREISKLIVATAYSLYQEEELKKILESYYFKGKYNYIILVKKESKFIVTKDIQKIYFKNYKLIEVFKYKQVMKYLLRELSKYKPNEVEIMIADVYQYLNNYLYGYACKKNIKITNYPDGLLNLVNYKVDYSKKIKIIIKKFLCKILRWDYYFYNYPSGIDKSQKIYTYNKSIIKKETYLKKNVEIIELSSKKKALMKYSNALIIGQDNLINVLGEKKYYNYILEQVKVLRKDNNIEKIYYKSHPKYLNQIFQTKIRKYCLLIEDDELVEKLIEKYKIIKASSFYSTALINLKNQYDDIECIAFKLEKVLSVTKEADINKLKKIFINYGIEIIE